jgi:hypothetical protein
MASVIENYSKFEVYVVNIFLQAEGVSQNEIHRNLVNGYGQKLSNQNEVSVWCNKFKDDRTALNDDPEKPKCRPRTLHTDENCVIVEGLIREYHVYRGARGNIVVKELCYKPEGRGFDTR